MKKKVNDWKECTRKSGRVVLPPLRGHKLSLPLTVSTSRNTLNNYALAVASFSNAKNRTKHFPREQIAASESVESHKKRQNASTSEPIFSVEKRGRSGSEKYSQGQLALLRHSLKYECEVEKYKRNHESSMNLLMNPRNHETLGKNFMVYKTLRPLLVNTKQVGWSPKKFVYNVPFKVY